MNKKRKRQNLFAKAKESLDFWTEAVILEFTEELARVMQEASVTSAELAERIGTSPAYVSKVLNGNANPSLATMTKFARALGGAVHIHLADEHAVVTWSDRASQHVIQDIRGQAGAARRGEIVFSVAPSPVVPKDTTFVVFTTTTQGGTPSHLALSADELNLTEQTFEPVNLDQAPEPAIN